MLISNMKLKMNLLNHYLLINFITIRVEDKLMSVNQLLQNAIGLEFPTPKAAAVDLNFFPVEGLYSIMPTRLFDYNHLSRLGVLFLHTSSNNISISLKERSENQNSSFQ